MTDHCHADALPTYARAAELAAHRASLVRPVAVSDAEPLRIPETKAVPTYRPRQRPMREHSGGRPKATVPKVAICKRYNAAGVTIWVAYVRLVGGVMVYVGRYEDKEAAVNDCLAFIETGEKPEPKTAKRRGWKKRIVPDAEPQGAAKGPLRPKRHQPARKPVPEPPRAKTALSSAERIEMWKAAYRRTA